jgi:hypothetical protein
MTPEEFGYNGDLDLTNYTIISTVSGAGRTVIPGMELEYSQSLSFLPRPFNGFNVRASYTPNYAEVTLPLMQKIGANPAVVTGYQSMGTVLSLGLQGTF